MSFCDEFKVGQRFNYLGTEMLVVLLPTAIHTMTIHYMSGLGELKEHTFQFDDFEAVIAHVKDMDEYYSGLKKAIEESL